MSEKQFLIVWAVGAILVELLVMGGLRGLGADSETIASAYGLVLGAEALDE
jgi:hypothetical protein